MKMTQEEKAKAYDEALERAKNIRFGNPQSVTANTVCEQIFPVLKESDDEKVRKEIISFITDRKNWFPKEETKASWIAWLEKQGEQKPSWSEEDECIMDNIIVHLKHKVGAQAKVDIDWLKSLKERMKGDKAQKKLKEGGTE